MYTTVSKINQAEKGNTSLSRKGCIAGEKLVID